MLSEDTREAPQGQTRRGLLGRLATRNGFRQFVRNFLVSILSFGSDLALLWGLVEFAHMNMILAVVITFVFANTVHYLIGRRWIFVGSERGMTSGYVYFLISATIGLVLTVALYWLLVAVAGVDYIAARIIVSIVAGFAVFLMNTVLIFRTI